MTEATPGLIDDWERARAALSPLRRRLLEALREPASAAMLAERLKLKRQMLGYHLNALEEAGLVKLHSVRRRRGFEERLLVVSAERFVLDPALLSGRASADKQDRFAADHLVAVAAETVREVTRMQGAAEAGGKRLITFSIEADVRFSAPEDIERFTARLAESVAGLIGEFSPAGGKGRAYRLTIGGHPAVAGKPKAKIN